MLVRWRGKKAVYWRGAKCSFAVLMTCNTLTGTYIEAHEEWFYGYLGLPAVLGLSFVKAGSYAIVWPLFWPYVAWRWAWWPHRPCRLGCIGRASFWWTYNRHGLVPHCIPNHDNIVAHLNPRSDYRGWCEWWRKKFK
jgi:hypothetical protein